MNRVFAISQRMVLNGDDRHLQTPSLKDLQSFKQKYMYFFFAT